MTRPSLGDVDAVILPGGFSYGDYLRCGAIAKFSPVMQRGPQVRRRWRARARRLQRLPDSGGGRPASRRADPQPRPQVHLPRACACASRPPIRPSPTRREKGQVLRLPIAHGEGCYIADERTLDELEAEDRVAFRYIDNPNGSLRDIAGILNRERNVMGMMPHPERATEPLMGSTDGLIVFQSMAQAARVPAAVLRMTAAISAGTHRPASAHARPNIRRSSTSWAASPATPNSASSA